MNKNKNLMSIQKDKIISLAKEYAENVKCSCGPECCWRCLFDYNLNLLASEESAVEDRCSCEECCCGEVETSFQSSSSVCPVHSTHDLT